MPAGLHKCLCGWVDGCREEKDGERELGLRRIRMNTFGSCKHKPSQLVSFREEYLDGGVEGEVGVHTQKLPAYIHTYLKQ